MINKQTIILASIFFIIAFTFGWIDTASIYGQNPSGYSNYYWNSDGTKLTFESIESREYGFFESKHVYIGSREFESQVNINNFVNNADCRVFGNNIGWFEGEGSSGSGSYDLNGVVGLDRGIPYCRVSLDDYYAQQKDPNSALYKSWWSKPGRVSSFQSTKISQGTVEFTLKTIAQSQTPTGFQDSTTDELKQATYSSLSFFDKINLKIQNAIDWIFGWFK